jgi:hypothetical protein
MLKITDTVGTSGSVYAERDSVSAAILPWYQPHAPADVLAILDELQSALDSGEGHKLGAIAVDLGIEFEHVEYDPTTVTQRVQAGVDEIILRNYTLREIDLDILDICDPDRCPAGQTFGYCDTYRAMSATFMPFGHKATDAWMIERGFYYHDADDQAALDAEWRRVIGEAQRTG